MLMMRVVMAKLRQHPISRLMLIVLVFISCPEDLIAAAQGEINEWLQAHNSYRVLHGTSPLVWSAALAASAQAYAETCSANHSGSGHGENLAWASYDMGRSLVVKMWYDEEILYDYSKPGFDSSTGHFTQLLWKGTAEIGCGYAGSCAHAGSGMKNVWVCQYDPPGNYRGEFPENVLPKNTPAP